MARKKDKRRVVDMSRPADRPPAAEPRPKFCSRCGAKLVGRTVVLCPYCPISYDLDYDAIAFVPNPDRRPAA